MHIKFEAVVPRYQKFCWNFEKRLQKLFPTTPKNITDGTLML